MRVAIIILTTTVLAGPAMAADLAMRPAEPMAPVNLPYSWTGFYLGAQAGYEWGAPGYHTAGPQINFKSDGGVIGGYGGYDYQFNRFFVAGAMVDANFGFGKGNDGGQGGSVDVVDLGFEGALRARVGLTYDRFMIYASAGGALLDEKWKIPAVGFSESKTRMGWTVGGGVEYALTDHWRLRIDYRYSDYGNSDYDPRAVGQALRHTKLTTNEVLAGISYRF